MSQTNSDAVYCENEQHEHWSMDEEVRKVDPDCDDYLEHPEDEEDDSLYAGSDQGWMERDHESWSQGDPPPVFTKVVKPRLLGAQTFLVAPVKPGIDVSLEPATVEDLGVGLRAEVQRQVDRLYAPKIGSILGEREYRKEKLEYRRKKEAAVAAGEKWWSSLSSSDSSSDHSDADEKVKIEEDKDEEGDVKVENGTEEQKEAEEKVSYDVIGRKVANQDGLEPGPGSVKTSKEHPIESEQDAPLAKKKRKGGSLKDPNTYKETELQQFLALKAEMKKKREIKFEAGQTNHPPVKMENCIQHGLISTILEAYNKHLPLILSPDDFWLLIAQGLAQFLGQHKDMAEKYRGALVGHEGQKGLALTVEEHPSDSVGGWPAIMRTFRDQIVGQTGAQLGEMMTKGFSTTGEIEEVVYAGTLMETMKNHFSYRVQLACGIPEITLTGTVGDYEDILGRIDRVRQLFPDLAWWVDKIRPHLEKVLESVQGSPRMAFWREMLLSEWEQSHSYLEITGWIGDFVPYAEGPGGGLVQNNGSFLDDLPYGISFTDVMLEGFKGEEWHLKLATGFLGAHQERPVGAAKGGGALRPVIGLMVFSDPVSLKPEQAS